MQYMELIPESQRPVSGTVGALERRRQLFSQLPVYDQDPMKCQSLASEEEVGNNTGNMLTLAWYSSLIMYILFCCATNQFAFRPPLPITKLLSAVKLKWGRYMRSLT